MLYELFEFVGKGNGDHGSEWKRVAIERNKRAALDAASRHRSTRPSSRFRMFASRSANSIGRLLWEFPPLNA